MKKLLPFFALCVSVIHAADSLPALPSSTVADPMAAALASRTNTSAPGKNLWRISLTTLGISNALDIQSSWGKHELNSTLASPSGDFGVHGALLKLGFQGGLVGVEYLLTRHYRSPRLYRALAIINFGASAGIAGVAAHNYTVAPPGR